MNRVFTLTFSQMMAASPGLFSYLFFGPGYLSGGVAMTAILVILEPAALRLIYRYKKQKPETY